MSENLFHLCSFYEKIKGKHTVTKRQERELGLRWTRVSITTSVHIQCAQPVCTSSCDPGKHPALTSNVKTSPVVCRADILRPGQARHSGARHRVWGPLKGHSPYHYGVMVLTFLLFSFVFHVHLLDLLTRCEHHASLVFQNCSFQWKWLGQLQALSYNDIHKSNIKTASIL